MSNSFVIIVGLSIGSTTIFSLSLTGIKIFVCDLSVNLRDLIEGDFIRFIILGVGVWASRTVRDLDKEATELDRDKPDLLSRLVRSTTDFDLGINRVGGLDILFLDSSTPVSSYLNPYLFTV